MSISTSKSPSFDGLKTEINKFTKLYDWNSASQLCDEFLKSNRNSDKRVFELLGNCYYNLAFQQNTRDEFKKVILRAKEAYERVADDNRFRARAAFCKYWASDNPDERRRLLTNECLPLARQLVAELDSSVDKTSLTRAHSELLEYLLFASEMATERKQAQELVNETKLAAQNAFLLFQSPNNNENLIPIFSTFSLFLLFASGILIDGKEGERLSSEIFPTLENLANIAEKMEDSRLESLGYEAIGIILGEFKGDHAAGSSILKKAITEAEQTRDRYLIGRLFSNYAHSLGWEGAVTEIAEQKKELLEKALEYSARAIEYLRVAIVPSDIDVAFWRFVGSSTLLSKDAQQVSEKLEYLEKAIDAGRESVQFTNFCPTSNAPDTLLWALSYKAQLVNDKNERIRLLSEAVSVCEDHILRLQTVGVQDSFNIGVFSSRLGKAKSDLSDEKKEDPQEREALLKESSSDIKRGFDITVKSSHQKVTDFIVARISEMLGDTLLRLYEMSHRREDSVEAIKAYDEAVNILSKHNWSGFMAPISWKTAKLYDSISEYAKSSRTFTKAGQQYETASKSQKSLQKSFADLSLYMQAWSKIEEARLLHSDEKYLAASERLKEASDVLGKTEDFRYLSKHYQAFSKMESAEELSRKESNIEASFSFGEAYELFEKSKQEILDLAKQQGADANNEDELGDWARLSESRGKYCLARQELDEARALDKNGEVKQSMSKYCSAAETLKQLEQAVRTRRKRRKHNGTRCFSTLLRRLGNYEGSRTQVLA